MLTLPTIENVINLFLVVGSFHLEFLFFILLLHVPHISMFYMY